MNGAEVLEAGLLGEDEDDGVVAVAAAGVHGDGGRLVHHHQVLRHRDQADAGRRHRDLVPAMAGYLLYTVSVTQRRFYSHYRWLIHSLPLLCPHNSLYLSVLLLFFLELVCVETFIGRGAGGVVRTQLVHSLKMSCVNKHELLLHNLITMSDNIYYNRQGAGRRDMTADSRHLAPPDST